MKVIDLLNKIANSETPKRILYDKQTYWYDGMEQDYYTYTEKDLDDEDIKYLFDYKITEILNDEVEIIEDTPKEDKKIEKLDVSKYYDANVTEIHIMNKINEMIERLNGEE